MKYEHPNVAVLGSAVNVVLSEQRKLNVLALDGLDIQNPFATDGSAYQGDE